MSIEITKVTDFTDSQYLTPKRVFYTQNGVEKIWDVVKVHNSVAILIYNSSCDSFVLVKQFRPAVYLANQNGFTYELCAGIVDKDKSLLQIAKEEIEEETGFVVAVENIEKIASFYTSVGFAGGEQTMYFAKVDDSLKLYDGGGVDIEEIEVVNLPLNEAKDFIFDESYSKTSGLMYAFMWFFEKYQNKNNIA